VKGRARSGLDFYFGYGGADLTGRWRRIRRAGLISSTRRIVNLRRYELSISVEPEVQIHTRLVTPEVSDGSTHSSQFTLLRIQPRSFVSNRMIGVVNASLIKKLGNLLLTGSRWQFRFNSSTHFLNGSFLATGLGENDEQHDSDKPSRENQNYASSHG